MSYWTNYADMCRQMRMGATHFLMKTVPRVATEMALHVLAYNLTRVVNISAFNRSWRR
jgi:hypothetical protein